ncbi:MAG: ATP-dependent sacrificial sulfur transferase LarE [Pseudomonadales bacterium]
MTSQTDSIDIPLASAALQAKYDALKASIDRSDRAVVAFSGGIDSSLVAYVSGQVLGDRAVAVTSGSASLKRSDLELAQRLAEDWQLSHRVIYTNELQKADYRANPVNRCFHCKTSLYEALAKIAEEEGIDTVFNGTNTDDLGDHRPGLIAADNFNVRSPLIEAQFNKQDIRELAEHLGLENAQKPQAACLSSRFPYGTAIDEAKLAQVEDAEVFLEQLGFTQFRVRHHDTVARLELLPEQFERAMRHNELINQTLVGLGYSFVALDLKGFRSGALNETLQRIDTVQIYDETHADSASEQPPYSGADRRL